MIQRVVVVFCLLEKLQALFLQKIYFGDKFIQKMPNYQRMLHFFNKKCISLSDFVYFCREILKIVMIMNIRFGFFLLFLFIICASCSKDEESSNRPEGQYVFKNDTILVAVNFENGKPNMINTFIRGGSVSQIRNLTTSGEYPQLNVSYSSYPSEELQMSLKFNDVTSFIASVSLCELEKGNWAWYYAYKNVVLPKQMNFKQDNTILDMNGDGILDSSKEL